jgi:hypothetical protein
MMTKATPKSNFLDSIKRSSCCLIWCLRLPTQRVIIGAYDLAHTPIPAEGRFVDGVFCIDVHTNGMSEKDNTVPMQAVRNLFLQAVHTRLRIAGITV